MLSNTTLNLMSSKALAATSNSLTSKAAALASGLSAAKARQKRLSGFSEVSTSFNGKKIVTMGNYVNSGQKSIEQATGVASNASLAQTLSDGGQEVYEAGTLPPGVTGDATEINTMNLELQEEVGTADNLATSSKSLAILQSQLATDLETLTSELNGVNENLSKVQSTLKQRASGELPNPVLRYENIEAAVETIISNLSSTVGSAEELDALREGVTRASNKNIDDFEDYILNRVILPYEENTAALDIIAAQLRGIAVEAECAPIFDTVVGPPVSYFGKFILSENGIYYDSRSGGIPYIAAHKIDANAWQLRYASNRGGKGEMYAGDKATRLSDTIFDDDYKNNTGSVLDFYKYDDVLRALQNDRDLRVQDVSGRIDDLMASGFAASSATIKNYKESYAAIAYAAEVKIKKRKKQLQVAALFGPFGVTNDTSPLGPGAFYRQASPEMSFIDEAICGSFPGGCNRSTTEYANSGVEITPFANAGFDMPIEYIPRIPLNDFTYLKEIGMVPEIDSQKSAMLISEDLDDTTNPIVPTFLEKGPNPAVEAIPEMSISPHGITDWVTTSGDTDLEGTIPYIRTLTDSIVTRNLIACYNFLEPSGLVTSPSSTLYGVRNYARTGTALDGKLVGESVSSVFTSGVSIPFLEGTLYKPAEKYGIRYAHLPKGSYIRLPSNWKDGSPNRESAPLDDLMYGTSGWSFDFWAHVPTLITELNAAHRYRVIIANENSGDSLFSIADVSSGGFVTADTSNNLLNTWGSRTRGMVIGFRDKGDPVYEPMGLEFVVLPTVSQNSARWGKSVCISESVSAAGTLEECRRELGFKIPATVETESGHTAASCSEGFTHYALTCDIGKNEMTLYVNGEFLASGFVSTAFDQPVGQPLNIPTRISEGFFQGDGVHGEGIVGSHLPGNVVFTPWVIGGGFTDGIEHQTPPIFSSTFPGFLGINTNDDYFIEGSVGVNGGPIGQHTNIPARIPGLGGYTPIGGNYALPRSGLDGHLGSFKIYNTPLTKEEVTKNYESQNPFFSGIKVPHRLL